jgi:hypothetical protein
LEFGLAAAWWERPEEMMEAVMAGFLAAKDCMCEVAMPAGEELEEEGAGPPPEFLKRLGRAAKYLVRRKTHGRMG